MRILVVEDEQKIADALKKGLEVEGYQVSTAVSGEEGFFCLTGCCRSQALGNVTIRLY